MDRQLDRDRDKCIDRQTVRQRSIYNRQIDKQRVRQIDKQKVRWIDKK